MSVTPIHRTVLIIDDDLENLEYMRGILSDQFNILTAVDGEQGIRTARTSLPDAILLDINMPRLNGFSACEDLRNHEATRHIPVLFVTSANGVDERVQAFARGADDFISKPFKPREMVARLQAKIRRIEEQTKQPELIVCGNLTLNTQNMELKVAGESIQISALEFKLLKFFLQNSDTVLTRERFLQAIWADAVVSLRTVDTHIASLRKRLRAFDQEISTIYGVGYLLKTHIEPAAPRAAGG